MKRVCTQPWYEDAPPRPEDYIMVPLDDPRKGVILDHLEQVEILGVGNTKTPKKGKRENQSCHWCFTLNNPDELDNVEQAKALFAKCSRYVYQLEEGDEEKTPHWQGYFKLSKKARFSQIQKWLPGWHLEKCNNIDASIEYCQKTEGRLDGPWSMGFKRKVADPLLGLELRPFQQEIVDLCETEPDDRTINWYYDKKGNIGKTSLAKHLALKFPREFLYLTGKAGDMKFAIMKFMEVDENDLKIVIMDFPRSAADYISYGGIEEIKNGIFFSGKYEGGMLIFNSPHVICLANFEPEKKNLSADRWNIVKL